MIERVAVIFDNSVRPGTTGLYCRRALGQLVDVEHVLPGELQRISPHDFDLFLNVDDGLEYEWPDHLRPCAYWAIDTHLNPARNQRHAAAFDHVFTAQKPGVNVLRQAGIDEPVWLPLACDPIVHRPYDIPKEFDVGFVGNLIPGPRTELLDAIGEAYPQTFCGRRYFEQMAQIYSSCRIAFNRSVTDDLNMRVFETLACGAMLLTNAQPESGQEELFQDGVHLTTYRDQGEVLERIDFYLRHDAKRERIARQGRAEGLARHTYLHRMTTLLRSIEQREARTQVAITADQPGEEPTEKMSACLIAWKRHRNIREIVRHLQAEPLIDDIVVWNNNPDEPLHLDADDVTVYNSPKNLVTYGRYLAVQLARHDVIYTQDDDCLVHNIGELHETYRLQPDRLAHAMKLGHLLHNSSNTFEDSVMGLVGWGAIFHRSQVDVLKNYTRQYGEDELLIRKADRIFTLLRRQRHRPVLAQVDDLPGASGGEALSVRDDHEEWTRRAIQRCLELKQSDWHPSQQQRSTDAEFSRPVRETVTAKEAGYFEHARPDVLQLIPRDAARILEIGCGGGRLGATIKQRQNAHVTGIEYDPSAARRAEQRLDDVRIGDIETAEIAFSESSFDCIVCADVLEHLRDPLCVLKRVREWLTEDGVLVTSLPNVRNHTVIQSLLAGNWTYESAGLLDADHVRFFTRREIEKLLFRAGFGIDEMRMVGSEGFHEWNRSGQPQNLSIGGLQINAGSPEEAAEFFAYQYLTVSRPLSPQHSPGRTRRRGACEEGRELLMQRIQTFREQHPWPRRKPDVELPTQHLGWLGDGSRELLQRELSTETQLVIELGSWLGLSTRFIAEKAPNATIIAVDHWKGSPEHQRKPEWNAMLLQLFESFQALSWEQRDRIIPLRTTTIEGLQQIAEAGLEPDVIFFDAEHAYESVCADLELARQLFPESTLVGDDFDDAGVARAVKECAERDHLSLSTAGLDWRAWKLIHPALAIRSPRLPEAYGLTSIIIVTFNQLEYTRQCADSIRLLTDEPYELIFVDNASSDATPAYLRSLEQADDVTVILNDENRGFPAAVNQGLEVAIGDNILLLNNDTLVTTGWLRRMLDALHSSDDVGLVGPVSNSVSGPQQVVVNYGYLNELDGFAWDWGREHCGQIAEIDRLVGFCLLFKRDVMERIGTLDERFGIGNFEDDDFCRRAGDAGYRCLVAVDSFVHHFGSVSFKGAGVDFAGLLRENEQKYREKWHGHGSAIRAVPPTDPPPPLGTPRPEFVIEATDEGLQLEPNTIKLSACLIVRDNEDTIRPCLESVKPWVDEIVVVDTGSIDTTPDICRELGARVFHWPWRDSFAAARNASLDHARGEWIFWLDSDDTLPEECGRQLREIVDGEHPDDVLGYVAQVHCPGETDSDITVVDHVKLFPNRPDLRFEFRIHEQIIPSIRRAGGEVAWSDLYVVHSGSDRTEEGRARKLERDFRLLELELGDRPEHPFVLFNLGMTHADARQYEPAIDYLQHCIQVSGPEESHVRKAFALLVSSLCQAGRHEEAWDAVVQGLQRFRDDKELLFRQAMLYHHFGNLNEAERLYLRILTEQTERHFTSVDSGIAGFKARHNLAVVYEDMGRPGDAIEQWKIIVNEHPDYFPAWRRLGELLVEQNCSDELAKFSQGIAKKNELRDLTLYLQGRIAIANGEYELARRNFEEAAKVASDEAYVLRELERLLFEHFSPAAAIPLLRESLVSNGEDASTWHNLGVALMENGEWDEAEDCFNTSLQLRPDAAQTRSFLQSVTAQRPTAERSVTSIQTVSTKPSDSSPEST